MELLSLDPATSCGWGLSPPFREVERIRVGSWQLPPGAAIQVKVATLTQRLIKLCQTEKIGYAAIEIPLESRGKREIVKQTPLGFEKVTVAGGSRGSTNQLWAIHGACIAVLSAFGIPFRAVGVKEWRADVLGNGNMSGDDSKRLCREKLEARNVMVPNVDAAEAGGVLFWLQRHYRRFIAEDAALRKAA